LEPPKGNLFCEFPCGNQQILITGWLWLSNCTWTQSITLTSFSEVVVTNSLGYYRQMVSESLANKDTIIGVPGIIAEIDEAEFGKRKYNRGHRIDGFKENSSLLKYLVGLLTLC